jgi:hypothetical protein
VPDLATQRARIDEVDERPLAVDLHDGKPFAVLGLELRVAADVDLVELEPQLVARGPNGRERPLAEVTLRGVEDDDVRRYG